MWWISPYTKHILSKYREHLEFIDSLQTGLTGVASERPAPVTTNEVNVDALYFAAFVNFNNAGVLVRITTISPQYQWMTNQAATPQDTPIHAIAGVFSQVTPILPLIKPFFVKAQGRLLHQFTNAAVSPAARGIWTWRALKLIDPIDGGWDDLKGYGL